MTYLILQHPGHNRVYYESAEKLAIAELQLAGQRCSVSIERIEPCLIGGIRYISFDTQQTLTRDDMEILSRLSFLFAFFQVHPGKEKMLIPLKKTSFRYFDDKLGSLLKYSGKTNELFTRMMIHTGFLSGGFEPNEKIRLLDPVAGKGTTLFEAAGYGFDAFGIEIDASAVHDSVIFFKKFLERERIMHSFNKRRVSGAGKSDAVNIEEFRYGKTREELNSDMEAKNMGMICGNTLDTGKYFRKNYFHLIVGDLPYGISHGNVAGRKKSAPTRDPSELLALSLPGWHKVLKRGGVVVVAWNSHIVPGRKLASAFSSAGFDILTEKPYKMFEHRVDNSIKRDIIVARKEA